jgi:hypothetical protein
LGETPNDRAPGLPSKSKLALLGHKLLAANQNNNPIVLSSTIQDENQSTEQSPKTSVHNTVPMGSAASNEFSHSMGSDQVAGTTIFHTDLRAATNIEPSAAPRGSLPVRDQSISEFMAKPVYIYTGAWTTSGSSNYTLYSTSTGIAPLIAANAVWADKVIGFENYRGTLVFRCTLNTNPFQQGRLILSFVPMETSLTSVGSRTGMLSQITNLPHVEIDCRDGVGILKIPYIAPPHYYNVKTALCDWGNVYLNVFSPLQTGSSGETTVNVSLALYFEDFELAAPLVPQAGKKRAITSMSGKEAEASDIAATGVVSGTASLIAKGAAAVASSVPELAWFAQPVSWVASAVSSVASWFGWSKPINESVPIRVYQQSIPYSANGSGVSNALPLSLRHDNALEYTADYTPEIFDEMSFEYLKRRFAYFGTINWADTQSSGTSLESISIQPNALEETSIVSHNSHTATIKMQIPCGYLSNFFQYYRGSIRFKIKFVKTEFHTGRIQVTFTPTRYYTTQPTLATGAYALREIIDIRGKSELDFTLPYLFADPWITTSTGIGTLDIVIVNELRHPETASSSINILLFAAGGDDFELAAPAVTAAPSPFVPQSGVASVEQPTQIRENIGGYKVPDIDSYSNDRLVMGEVFTSLKQLLNRYSPVAFTTTTSGSYGAFGINLWTNDLLTINTSTGALVLPQIGQDLFSALTSGFVFQRGSMRACVYNVTNPTYPSCYTIAPATTKFVASISGSVAKATANSTSSTLTRDYIPVSLQNSYVGVTEAAVPYYNNWPVTINDPASSSTNTASSTYPPFSFFSTNGPSGTTTVPAVYRAAGDDFQLLYFIGFFPIVTAYS